MRCSVSVIASGWTGQPGRLISGAPASRDEAVAEVVAQAHRARRVVAHRGNAAVGRARAERHHDRGARRQPVDPRRRGDRLALVVDSEAAPVPLAVDLLVRDRALDDEHERIELAARGGMPGAQVVVADVVGEQRVVERDARLPGDRAAQQLLEARAGGGRQRDRLAVAAEAARQPEHVDDQALDARAVAGEVDRPLHAPTAASAGTAAPSRRAPGRWASAARCSRGRAVQVQRAVTARDELGLREPRQRVRDRRPLGADEPAEQAVREREREADAAGLDAPPAPGQVPEQQRQPHLEARLRGDRALDVEIGGSRAGAREQRARDLRPRLDCARRTPRRAGRGASARARARPTRARAGRRRVRRAAAGRRRRRRSRWRCGRRRDTSTLSAPSITSTPGPWPTCREAAREVAVAGRRREDDGGHDLPGHEAHAQVELCGEVVVEIEQVAVRRGRQRVDARELAQAGPLLVPRLVAVERDCSSRAREARPQPAQA